MSGHLTDEQWSLGQAFARAKTKDEASDLLDALVAARLSQPTDPGPGDPHEALRALLAEHRPNVVTEGAGDTWQTRVKCDGRDCEFYFQHQGADRDPTGYLTTVAAHTDHLTEVVAEFIAVQHHHIAADRDRYLDAAAACLQGIEGHACCDCPAPSEQDLRDQIAAIATTWTCNCGGPSPEGQHEMHCDSYYGDRLRSLLRLGDDLGLRMRDARIARDALTAYADAIAENPDATGWDGVTIANDAREWAQEHHG